jgi:hypothetical protein
MNKLKHFLSVLPSTLIVVGAISVVISFWEPSAKPDILFFSWARFVAIILAGLFIFYGVAGIAIKRLNDINLTVIISLLFGAIITEALVRFNPALIPTDYLNLLPKSAAQNLGEDRGLVTQNNLQGDGLFFAFKPGSTFSEYPWVTIDSNGFANAAIPDTEVDIVLLGASVMQALAVPKTFTSKFEENGYSAYSLAQGGPYGPQQYRNAYRQFIINRDIKHKHVYVLLVLPNELDKAFAYERARRQGANYKDLWGMSSSQSIMGDHMPWVISLAIHLPSALLDKWRNRVKSETTASYNLQIAGKNREVPANWFTLRRAPQAWDLIEVAMRDIAEMAESNEAKMTIVYYPIPSYVLAGVPNSISAPLREANARYRNKLATISKNVTANFVDLTLSIAPYIVDEQIFVTPLEYHLNQRGVDIVFESLLNVVDTAQSFSSKKIGDRESGVLE